VMVFYAFEWAPPLARFSISFAEMNATILLGTLSGGTLAERSDLMEADVALAGASIDLILTGVEFGEVLLGAASSQAALAATTGSLAATASTELGGVTRSRATTMAGALAGIVYTELEHEAFTQEAARLAALQDVWTTAISATPGRVAAAVPILIANEIEGVGKTIDTKIGQMGAMYETLATCISSGRKSNSAMSDAALTLAVSEAVVEGIAPRASDVISELNELIVPTAIADVTEVFDAAKSLLGTIAAVPAAAAEAYSTETAADQADAREAQECSVAQHFSIMERYDALADDLSALRETIDALQAATVGKGR
jgi:hypothetical protein